MNNLIIHQTDFTRSFKNGKIVAKGGQKRVILEGTVYKENRMLKQKLVTHDNPEVAFSQELEETLLLLCHEMKIPIPMWMSTNTKEFAAFQQTCFFADYFNEEVEFDRFKIKLRG